MATKTETKIANRIFMYLLALAAVISLVLAGLALWAHLFISDMVKTELTAQKIYFPAAGSPGLPADEYPDLQKYGGELVDTPAEAKAYANGFIGRHLDNIADGKTYAEVSTLARQNPDDATLQQQRESLLQGETLRGVLLTSGYGFGTVGHIAGIAAYVLAVAGAVAAALALYFRGRL